VALVKVAERQRQSCSLCYEDNSKLWGSRKKRRFDCPVVGISYRFAARVDSTFLVSTELSPVEEISSAPVRCMISLARLISLDVSQCARPGNERRLSYNQGSKASSSAF
jgi:hypothetical protein